MLLSQLNQVIKSSLKLSGSCFFGMERLEKCLLYPI